MRFVAVSDDNVGIASHAPVRTDEQSEGPSLAPESELVTLFSPAVGLRGGVQSILIAFSQSLPCCHWPS